MGTSTISVSSNRTTVKEGLSMKRTIYLLVALCCLLILIGCEKAPGEEILPPANETTQPTQITTAPTETTAPPETTVPQETTAPLVTEDIPYLRVFDTVSKADTEAAGSVIRIPELDPSGLVSAIHASFSTAMGNERPYDDGVFWECTDEQEMLSGSHYQCYAVEDGQLKKLENRTFAGDVSFLNGKTYLEFQYAVNDDQVILTYTPKYYSEYCNHGYSSVIDTSRGPKECLVYLTYTTEKNGKLERLQYFDFLNLETGSFMGIFADFDPAVFKNSDSWSFVCWTEDGDPVFSQNGTYVLFDTSTKTVIKDYPYSDPTLTFNAIHVDGKSYLEVTDPLDGETILLKMPEGWEDEESLRLSPDGRKLMARKYEDILIYDGDRNMWIDIQRERAGGIISEDVWYWTKDSEIVLASEGRTHVSVYRIAPE